MNEPCIFCKIEQNIIPATKLVDETNFFVIKDIHPKAPKHYLLIPKAHYALLSEQTKAQAEAFGNMLLKIKDYETLLQIEEGYSLKINQKAGGGQEVMHLHVHILAN